MKFQFPIAFALLFGAPAHVAFAQDKYEVFIGQYMASSQIARSCKGFTFLEPNGAATLAKTTAGLRKQKVLRLVFYSKTNQLTKLGHYALALRNVDANNQKQLCRFGRRVAGKDDAIGRFLRKN